MYLLAIAAQWAHPRHLFSFPWRKFLKYINKVNKCFRWQQKIKLTLVNNHWVKTTLFYFKYLQDEIGNLISCAEVWLQCSNLLLSLLWHPWISDNGKVLRTHHVNVPGRLPTVRNQTKQTWQYLSIKFEFADRLPQLLKRKSKLISENTMLGSNNNVYNKTYFLCICTDICIYISACI